MKRKTIGILGGMGPEASTYLYKMLIEQAITYFGAKNNDDFPEILLYSVPVPDFISDTKTKEKALTLLLEKVRELNKTNVSCLSIACNTAHMLLPNLAKAAKAPFISMIEEVAREVAREKRKKVGLLGTPSTLRSGLYQKALGKRYVSCIVPETESFSVLGQIIRNIIKNTIIKEDGQKLEKIADQLKKQGAEGIILGCTELPLVFPANYSLPVYNSVAILAKSLLRNYYK